MLEYIQPFTHILCSGFMHSSLLIFKNELIHSFHYIESVSKASVQASETVETFDLAAVLTNVNTIAGILLSIITGVSVLKGMKYLKSIKEKREAATFTFWAQLKVRMIRIHNTLKADMRLLNNMYPVEVRSSWEDSNPSIDKVKDFKSLVENTLCFLETTTDQMPAYEGWSNDFTNFMIFLSDVIQYDICNADAYFVEGDTFKNRNEYWRNVCNNIEELLKEIDKRQTVLETAIYRRPWWKRRKKKHETSPKEKNSGKNSSD